MFNIDNFYNGVNFSGLPVTKLLVNALGGIFRDKNINNPNIAVSTIEATEPANSRLVRFNLYY